MYVVQGRAHHKDENFSNRCVCVEQAGLIGKRNNVWGIQLNTEVLSATLSRREAVYT